ncbi:hypothetical protein PENTCL1PPCAC_26159 [Pristionchus entomophagus]|uniref:Complex I assembly factor TIMMDC1, mitochondrial n=1 Tax=Pristionchus entomophagus TaxID=358040 RepID=A0AAV5UCE1_9BILA|nr:hypothetical protein PENTCL1PPCAC_26159 [Pristionchus entomophagus]
MSSPSQSSQADSENESSVAFRSWWRWKWRSAPVSLIGEDEKKSSEHTTPSPSLINSEGRREEKAPHDQVEMSGWDRIRELYETESMEKDVVQRTVRTVSIGGFLIGGTEGFLQAKKQYEIANTGKKYYAAARRLDYAFVRYAMKGGFSLGAKTAFMSTFMLGSIVLLSTHTTTLRRKYSSLYFPAYAGPLTVLLHSALSGWNPQVALWIIGSNKGIRMGNRQWTHSICDVRIVRPQYR